MKIKKIPRSLHLILLPLALAACSHGSDGTSMEPTRHGAVAGDQLPFPAFVPDGPQVISLGGPLMTSPQAIAITFPDDALIDDIERFVAQVGATSYWSDTTSEYGVAPLVAGTPIRLTEAAPAAITDAEIQAWLLGKLDGTHPEFPAPDPNTIYALFYPAGSVIDDGGGKSCEVFGGYHNSTSLPNGTPVMYAVLPRCQDQRSSLLGTLTLSASHEIIEAVTDPQPLDNPAYLTVDDNHAIWTRLNGGGGEVGDMCAQNANAAFTPSDFPFQVQRSWSNQAAASGHDPCVPAASNAPYFGAAPRTATDQVTMTSFGGDIATEGFTIPVGESRTIVFELYSTGPTDAPIKVKAVDLRAQRAGATPTLSFSFDRDSGYNGERLSLTITALAASSMRSGVTSFAVVSSVGTEQHPWIGVVQAQ